MAQFLHTVEKLNFNVTLNELHLPRLNCVIGRLLNPPNRSMHGIENFCPIYRPFRLIQGIIYINKFEHINSFFCSKILRKEYQNQPEKVRLKVSFVYCAFAGFVLGICP